jgi:hypothetical protein
MARLLHVSDFGETAGKASQTEVREMNYGDIQIDGSGAFASFFTLSSWLQPVLALLLLAIIGVCVVFGVVAFAYWILEIIHAEPDAAPFPAHQLSVAKSREAFTREHPRLARLGRFGHGHWTPRPR